MAEELGDNSPKLTYSIVGMAARPAQLETDGTFTFARGTVDQAGRKTTLAKCCLTAGDTGR